MITIHESHPLGCALEGFSALGEIQTPHHGVLLVEANGPPNFITLIAAVTARAECRRITSLIQLIKQTKPSGALLCN